MSRYDYNISNSAYSVSMSEKTQQYKNAMRDAELAQRDHGGVPSEEEANCYRQAAMICTQIIHMNMGEPALLRKWTLMKQMCEDELLRVRKALEAEQPGPTAKWGC